MNVLHEEKYIQRYNFIEDKQQGLFRVYLKYTPERRRVITNLKRISRPGLRKYVGAKEVPNVLGGLGLAIISTSKGVMSDPRCRQENLGGEVICYIW